MYIQRRASDDAGNETNLYFVSVSLLSINQPARDTV